MRYCVINACAISWMTAVVFSFEIQRELFEIELNNKFEVSMWQ